LFAGAVATELGYGVADEWQPNDCTELSVRLYRSVVNGSQDCRVAVYEFLRETRGGRNLRSLGFDSDIRLCSQFSEADVIPEFDAQDGQLKSARRD